MVLLSSSKCLACALEIVCMYPSMLSKQKAYCIKISDDIVQVVDFDNCILHEQLKVALICCSEGFHFNSKQCSYFFWKIKQFNNENTTKLLCNFLFVKYFQLQSITSVWTVSEIMSFV